MYEPTVLPPLVDSVRKRPAMYFGGTGPDGMLHAALELVANGIDQFLAGRATMVSVAVDPDARGLSVEDDGPGLPFDEASTEPGLSKALLYLTRVHRTPTADEHSPHIHVLRFGGVGLAAVNAISERFVCSTTRGDSRWHQSFRQGSPDARAATTLAESEVGTRLVCRFDPEIWGPSRIPIAELRAALFHAAHLFSPIRIRIDESVFQSPEGLVGLLPFQQPPTATARWRWRAAPPLSATVETGGVRLELAAAAECTGNQPAVLRSWVNGVETTSHGDHVSIVLQALAEAHWQPHSVLIHMVGLEPNYAGPTKDRLDMPGLRQSLKPAVTEAVRAYLAVHRPA